MVGLQISLGFGTHNPPWRTGGGGGGGDQYFSSTKLLLGFNGTNGSATMTDESSTLRGNATVLAQAQISTAQKKFGSGSLLLDGTNDGISFADSADWEFGSGAFTVECFVRFVNNSGNQMFFSHTDSGGVGWNFYKNGGSLEFAASGVGIAASSAWSTVNNQWYHVACDRDGSGNTRIYADGTMLLKRTAGDGWGGTIGNPAIELMIGRISYVDTYNLNGYMDEARITKGAARYKSDAGFTVPTAAYPRS